MNCDAIKLINFQYDKRMLKSAIKKSFLYPFWVRFKVNAKINQEIKNWLKEGKKLPPPHEYKQHTVQKYAKAKSLNTLIETGTFKGNMVEALLYRFKKIISIELDQELYKEAKEKFRNKSHVVILNGDSSLILPKVLKDLEERALFWLDGHYSEGETAKGELETPIMSELKSIFGHGVKDHVVLIDDARLFNGTHDYPTIDFLEGYVNKVDKSLKFYIKNDIIRIYK